MTDLGEILDPVRKQVIDLKDALLHARYRYDGLDLILETVADSKSAAPRRRFSPSPARR